MYVDSNIFIYAAIDNTEKGEKARKIIEKITKGELKAQVSPLVWDEVVWVVQKLTNRDVAAEVGKLVLELPLVWLDISYDTVKAALTFYERGVKPRDAIHLGVMQEYSISEILTEDSDFDKISEIKNYKMRDIV